MSDAWGPLAMFYLIPFLGISGAIAIWMTLYRLFWPKHPEKPQPSSSFSTTWVKVRGPVGFVYGVAALFSMVYMLRTDQADAHAKELAARDSTVSSLRAELSDVYATLAPQTAPLDAGRVRLRLEVPGTVSLFQGQAVAQVVGGGCSGYKLRFTGSIAASARRTGPFSDSIVPFRRGLQFFVLVSGRDTWGLNLLDVNRPATLELFRVSTADTETRMP